MNNKSTSLKNVLASLPAVQAAIRKDVAARIAAGESIASDQLPQVQKSAVARRKAIADSAAGNAVEGNRSAA